MPEPTVLIIEPDHLQRDLMMMALKRNHIHPDACADLADLPNLLMTTKPSVLVMDMYLPGTNGLDLMMDLKERGFLDATRVIGVSAMAFPEVVRKMIQAGFSDFLVKPIDTDQFVARVQRILQK